MSAPDCGNLVVLEQKQIIFQSALVALFGHNLFLQGERVRKFHSAEPTHIKRIIMGDVHICVPPESPSAAASCARKCVRAIASASAASASGVSVKPRSARTINAT